MTIAELRPTYSVHLRHKTHGSFKGRVLRNDVDKSLLTVVITKASRGFKESNNIYKEGNHFAYKNIELIKWSYSYRDHKATSHAAI